MKIVKDSIYSSMFRVKWPNGDLSLDFYNKTWAIENSRRIAEIRPSVTSTMPRKRPEKAVGAFK